MKPSLFFIGSCACLLSGAFLFKSQSVQGALAVGALMLLSVGVLFKVLRS